MVGMHIRRGVFSAVVLYVHYIAALCAILQGCGQQMPHVRARASDVREETLPQDFIWYKIYDDTPKGLGRTVHQCVRRQGDDVIPCQKQADLWISLTTESQRRFYNGLGTTIQNAIRGVDIDDTETSGVLGVRLPYNLKYVTLRGRSALVMSEWLGALPSTLEEIDLYSNYVDDRVIDEITQLTPRLVELNIISNKVTDHAVCDIVCKTHVRRLSVASNNITGQLECESSNTLVIEELRIISNKYNPKYMYILQRMPHLSILGLVSSRISDEDLRSLSPLCGLEVLDLRRARVSVRGLEHLTCMGNLRVLNIAGTLIPKQELKSVEMMFPDCNVYGGPD